MATVTGLTAERMLEIEAESIIDGDVVGNNLILRRHDGTTIDAGPVKGPKGDTGPAGVSAAMASTPILDVGIAAQIRAGRALTVADFTNLGLTQPIALFNLTDLSNLGSGGPLLNKGAVPFGIGINGLSATAAVFAAATSQGLYIPDVGAGDPFRIKTGSWGCWFKTGRRGFAQMILSKDSQTGTNRGWYLYVNGTNQLEVGVSNDAGTNTGVAVSTADPCDDRWHFGVATFDGGIIRLYMDGVLEGAVVWNAAMFGSTSPFNVGGRSADASTANGSPFVGRIDEAFVTSDVLSEDQIRQLYCAKIPHGYSGTPKSVLLNVHRRRKGAAFVAGDFPAQPKRLYNFTDGAVTDAGVDNVALAVNNGALIVAGADGKKDGAYQFDGVNDSLTGTDAGLPTIGDRSIGCWFKTSKLATQCVLAYGSDSGELAFRLVIQPAGTLTLNTWTTNRVVSTMNVADNQWHFAVATYAGSPADGSRFRLYIDGRLVAESTSSTISTSLGGAGHFSVGVSPNGGSDFYQGDVDGAFVTDYVLNTEQIRSLYAKGAQDLGASPKNPGDHIEGFDATNIYATFDTIESQNLVDLAVMA